MDNELCPPEIDPNPNRARNLGHVENLGSRFTQSGVAWAGMGVGKPRGKQLEKLPIWPPGATSRAGAGRADFRAAPAETPGKLEDWGSGVVLRPRLWVEFQKLSFSESGRSEFYGERQITTLSRH